MDSNITTTTPTTPQTVSRGQLEALKGGIRAAATSNPAGMEHGTRCRDLTQTLCDRHHVRRLADLPADLFACAMKEISGMAVPQRRHGPAEAALRASKDRLDATLAEILQAMRGVAAFRREAEAALMLPLKSALEVDGKGNLECIAQDGVGTLLSMPLLQIEHELDRAHEVLAVLAARLPSIGRALDERGAGQPTS